MRFIPTVDRLDERVTPSVNLSYWTDWTGDHKFSNNSNWTNGSPHYSPVTAVFDHNYSDDYCNVDAAMSGDVPTPVWMDSNYLGSLNTTDVTVFDSGVLLNGGTLNLAADCTIDGSVAWGGGNIVSASGIQNLTLNSSFGINLDNTGHTLNAYCTINGGAATAAGTINLNGNICLKSFATWTDTDYVAINNAGYSATSMFYVGLNASSSGCSFTNNTGVQADFEVPVYVRATDNTFTVKSRGEVNLEGAMTWTDPWNGGVWGNGTQVKVCFAVDRGSGTSPNLTRLEDSAILGISGQFVNDSQFCTLGILQGGYSQIVGLGSANYIQQNSDLSEMFLGYGYNTVAAYLSISGAQLNFIRGVLDIRDIAYTNGATSQWLGDRVVATANAMMTSGCGIDLGETGTAGNTTLHLTTYNTLGLTNPPDFYFASAVPTIHSSLMSLSTSGWNAGWFNAIVAGGNSAWASHV